MGKSALPEEPSEEDPGAGKLRRFVLLVYLALGAGLSVVGVLRHRDIREAEILRQRKIQAALLDGQVRLVEAWLDRMDARLAFFEEDPSVDQALSGGARGGARDMFSRLTSRFDYKTAFLTDRRGKVLALAGRAPVPGPWREIGRNGGMRVFLGASENRFPALRFSRALPGGRGTLSLEIDPAEVVAPMMIGLQGDPRPETALFFRDAGSDEAVFLSPLADTPRPEDLPRVPLSLSGFPAREALLAGRQTFREFRDWRGTRSLATATPLKIRGWGLLTKIDRARALALASAEVRLQALAAGTLWVLAGGFLLGLDLNRRRTLGENALRHARELAARDQHLRKLVHAVEHSPVSIIITGRNGLIEFVNPKFCAVSGYAPEEVLGRKPGILKSGQTPPEEYRRLWETITAGKTWRGEFLNKRKNGEFYWESASISPVFDEAGEITHFIAIKEETTLLKETLSALKAREQKYRRLVEGLSREYIFFKYDDAGNLTYLSPSAATILGHPLEALLAHYSTHLTDDPVNLEVPRHNRLSLEGVAQPPYEVIFRHKDGSARRFEVLDTPVRDGGGKVVEVEGIARDVTERKRAELILRESEERFRDLIENLDELVQILDPEGRILFANRTWRKTLNYAHDDLSARRCWEFVAPEHQARCGEIWEGLRLNSGTASARMAFLAKDGRKVPVEVSARSEFKDGRLTQVRWLSRDLSLTVRLEQAAARAETLKSLGIFAGGVAHDFNNFLTAILGNLSLLKMGGNSAQDAKEMLAEAEAAGLRARDLARQLLTFSKGGDPIKRAVSLRAVVQETARLILAGSPVKLEAWIPADLQAVEADIGQIGQVIGNLVLNAKQAMPDGGKLVIRAENLVLDEAGVRGRPPLRSGPHVRIRVEDSGVGIPPENLAKIFDPYFTTKKEGSGLGLSICWSIIERHGGRMEVESRVGTGTAFTIDLPAVLAPAPEEGGAPEPAPRGAGRILVMDDEKAIRSLAARILAGAGYEVVQAEEGGRAVELFRQARAEGRPFSLVILDLTIRGGMGGKETMELLRREEPTLKVIVSTGYAEEPIAARFKDYGFSACVLKPYDAPELAGAVARILRGG